MAPLMTTGSVVVELLGKTSEMVFLVKDIFGRRDPPNDSLNYANATFPAVAARYSEFVKDFFSPPSPNKGYNPTLPVENVDSPIHEDREKISRILADRIQYIVIVSLRERPLTITDISEKTYLPDNIVQKVLFTLQSETIVIKLEGSDLWALLTDPRIDVFMPEYALPIVAKKLSEKEISPEATRRYLELLMNEWGVAK
jgi:hypothetical protein